MAGAVGGAAGGGRRRRVGILGGTFDPVHIGHLVAAVEARHELGLDEVLLVVANEPWQKTADRAVSPAGARYEVVAAAAEGLAGVEASRIEIDRGGPSYTIDTVHELLRRDPATDLFLVVGDDAAAQISTWHRVDELPALVTLVVVHRGGTEAVPDPPGWRVVRVEIPGLEISSTDLRARIAAGRPVDFLVPEPAIRCVRSLGLYAGSG